MDDLYDRDFYAWTTQQAKLLRAGAVADVDFVHLAEEMESLGRAERNRLINRLAVLLAHLLKWQFQPGLQSNSWRLAIKEQRRQAQRLMSQNPSLKPHPDAILAEAYGDALLIAERETGLPDSTFPPVCPWTFEQAVDK